MIKVIKEHSFFDDLLNYENVIIDLGACRGEFSNEIMKNYNVKKCIMVEPNPSNFIHLPKDIRVNKYMNLVSHLDNQEVVFYEDTKSPYNGSKIFNYFNGKEHKLKTITLETIFKENEIDFVDLLKIDIEGSEYELLENLSENILSKIKQITIEFHDFLDVSYKEKNIIIEKKLVNLGFNVLKTGTTYLNGSDYYDTLFYKK
jgi:FkbM family methyltransferase